MKTQLLLERDLWWVSETLGGLKIVVPKNSLSLFKIGKYVTSNCPMLSVLLVLVLTRLSPPVLSFTSSFLYLNPSPYISPLSASFFLSCLYHNRSKENNWETELFFILNLCWLWSYPWVFKELWRKSIMCDSYGLFIQFTPIPNIDYLQYTTLCFLHA